jgi:hypothetical protein
MDDPIKTPLGLAGSEYMGRTPISIGVITQLQLCWNYLATHCGVPTPTPITTANSSRQQITQLRCIAEACLTKLGLNLSYYFSHDRYGLSYSTTQSDWTDVDRTLGFPALPQRVPMKAIHIEELRRLILKVTEEPSALLVKTNYIEGIFCYFEFSGSFPFSDPLYDPLISVYKNLFPGILTVTFIDAHAKNFIIRIKVRYDASPQDFLSACKFIFIPPTNYYYIFDFGAFGFKQTLIPGLVVQNCTYTIIVNTHELSNSCPLTAGFAGNFTWNLTSLVSSFYHLSISHPEYVNLHPDGYNHYNDTWERMFGDGNRDPFVTLNLGYLYWVFEAGTFFAIKAYTMMAKNYGEDWDPLTPLSGNGDIVAVFTKPDGLDNFTLTVNHDPTLVF